MRIRKTFVSVVLQISVIWAICRRLPSSVTRKKNILHREKDKHKLNLYKVDQISWKCLVAKGWGSQRCYPVLSVELFAFKNSIQFSEKLSQFPGNHNATRWKGHGQPTHKSISLSDNCSWFPAWCSWRFTVKQFRSFKWSYFCRIFVKAANREHILRWCYK